MAGSSSSPQQVDALATGDLHHRHLVLSATSMRRNSAALVTHPIRGTTGRCRRWMLAWARSLIKRDCGSSLASPGQVEIR